MNIRERFANWLTGGQLHSLRATTDVLASAYSEAQRPDMLISRLQEYDSQLVQDLIDRIYWESVGSYGDNSANEARRQRAITASKVMWTGGTPLYEWAIRYWTAHGLGQSVGVDIGDEVEASVWNEYWEADRNVPVLRFANLQRLSNNLLVTGERYLAYFSSDLDGLTTVREVCPDEIAEIIYHVDDKATPVWFKRVYTQGNQEVTLYYPSWNALFANELENVESPPPMEQRANEMGVASSVVMQQVVHNTKDESGRGWPLAVASEALREHRRFLQDRLAVSRGKASAIHEWVVDGGSRAGAAVIGAIGSGLTRSLVDTNPPGVAGGSLVHNRAVEMRDLPMLTGASDAKQDHDMYSWYAALAVGLLPYSIGMDTQRYATALAMDKGLQLMLASYAGFWRSQILDMSRIVLANWERREYSG